LVSESFIIKLFMKKVLEFKKYYDIFKK
jgi:hypothetical protein